eukprot:scaffold34897_cov59-Phaeocystis_antarctica.AAC.5
MLGQRQVVKSAVPQLGSCASSGHAWRLWAVRHSQGRGRPTGRPATASDVGRGRPKAVKSAALEAARSSTRGSGWAPSGPASSWECRAAHSRQARPEEAQGAELGRCQGGALL